MTQKQVPYQDDSSSESDNESVEDVDQGGAPLTDHPHDARGTRVFECGHQLVRRVRSQDYPETSSTETQPAAMSARAYQVEMLEASLKQNVIVAMDTGSGKTQVAILRMIKEVERSQKLIWFLAPTVTLAEQQFKVIQYSIAHVQSKLLLGSSNPDKWDGPHIWQEFLTNVRIVVSTFQILFDALKHSMIQLGSLGLIVIDEAHNCIKKNSGARLMNELYWPSKKAGSPVPHILGLTASPLMRSNLNDLGALEKTLDSVCKSPNKHREELIASVNRPELATVRYGPANRPVHQTNFTQSMKNLELASSRYSHDDDPEIARLLADQSARGQEKLRQTVMENSTYVQKQLKSFLSRSREAYQNIGPWGADYFIHCVVSEFVVQRSTGQDSPPLRWADGEHQYLAKIVGGVQSYAPTLDSGSSAPTQLSRKVRELLNVLHSYQGDPVGVVFVTERYSAAVLCHLISIHPLTKDRYRVAAMVGTSTMPGRKADFLDLGQRDDLFSLELFRNGSKNLLIATSVLEEGIDVPACNLVVCFDKPSSLKSFIQRRGRARKSSSKLILMIDDNSTELAAELQKLEQEMKKKYEDDMRELKELEDIEESETADYEVLTDRTTGARMTIDDAKHNLERFCSTLTSRKFVNSSPYYITRDAVKEESPITKSSIIRATVFLPISLSIELRKFESVRSWRSEKNACRDAAFQAYKKLYEAGLINEHLLPLKDERPRGQEARVGMERAREQMDPWIPVAKAWEKPERLYQRKLTVTRNDSPSSENFHLSLPTPIPFLDKMTLYWDSKTHLTIEMDETMKVSTSKVPDHTPALLTLAYGYRMTSEAERDDISEKHNIVRFGSDSTSLTLDRIKPRPFDVASFGRLPRQHLLRQPANNNHPYYFVKYLPSKPPVEDIRNPYRGFTESPEDIPYVVVKNWPKKAGFFHDISAAPVNPIDVKPYPRVLPAEEIMVDSVPSIFASFAMMIPSITYALGAYLVASRLIEDRLSMIGLTDLPLVLTAITASKARWITNYEKLEFIGDALLKFCATVHCYARRPEHPEGLLSHTKDGIVSNYRLFKATVNSGLDQYILTNPLALQNWRPVYVEDLLVRSESSSDQHPKRLISTKTLADVVEALIGAAFVSTFSTHPGGDVSRAVECIRLFLPEEPWRHPDADREILYALAPADETLPEDMKPLEGLIGYEFKKKSLLIEAMTHASFGRPDARASLERLEFLGDAILDYLVVRRLYLAKNSAGESLGHSDMHLLRAALVNGDFIGFLVLQWSISRPRVDVDLPQTLDNRSEKSGIAIRKGWHEVALWQFMRHSSQEMGLLMSNTAARHRMMRDDLLTALNTGKTYPWADLARIQIQKLFSDVFESVIGAVWVDSGSLQTCEEVLGKAGVLSYLERILKDDVHVLHPKEELGHAAGQEKVIYEDFVSEKKDGTREFHCKIKLGEANHSRYVAGVEGGVTKEEARTRAAMEAIRVLGGNT